jgi:erythronate-4-phosphate dehydrogenase
MFTVVVDKEIILPDFILSNKALQIHKVSDKEITQKLLFGLNAYALIIRSVTKVDYQLLEGTSVHFVGTATSGDDHIDELYCMTNRITVRSAKGSNAIAVCEYVLLCLELAGKNSGTLGIVGYGEIGSRLANITSKLGFNVLVNDPFKRKVIEETTSFAYLSYEELMQTSEIISFHVPLHTKQFPTHNMLSQSNISLVQDTTTIIHSCRGSVIDEAIYSELVEQKNCRLYVDVWENEPAINPQSVLYAQLATPHIAGYTITAKQNAGAMVASHLMRHFFDEIIPVSTNTTEENETKNKANRHQQIVEVSSQLQSIAQTNPQDIAIEFEKIRSTLELLPEYLVDPNKK